MSHEITETDGAVFHKTKAWHGLGYVVEDAMTPTQALKLSGLDWTVSKTAGISAGTTYSDKFCAIVREDNQEILSVQSPDYKVVQNWEVFDLAYSVGMDVKIESALSLQGGKKIVCLIKGDSFSPANSQGDTITEYLALLSSHDGTIALSGLPTSVRVVCWNTLQMALNAGRHRMIKFTHTGNMEEKKASMRKALACYAETGKFFRECVNTLSNQMWTTTDIQKFFLDVYSAIEEPVTTNPQTEAEYKTYLDAVVTIARWSGNFDGERKELQAPASAWMAVNAITKDIQHHISVKGRKTGWENKAYNNLMGAAQNVSTKVANMALALV